MKRFLSIFLSLVLCFSICACNNNSEKTTSSQNDKNDKPSDSFNSSQDDTSSDDNTSTDEKLDNTFSDDLSSIPTLPTIDSSDIVGSNTVNNDKKREPYSNAQGYVEVTKLVTKNGRTYVEKEGKPFNLHSVHIRIDLIVQNKQLLNKSQITQA